MKKKLLLIVAVLAVFICIIITWRRWLLALPEVTLPVAQMPSPNAYDYYIEASLAIVPPQKPVDPVQDKPLIPKSQWRTYYPIAKKKEWLHQNVKARYIAREGFKYKCRAPLQRTLFSDTDKTRKLLQPVARMLVVESRVYSEQGDWGKASQSLLDVLKLGYGMAQGGTATDYMYSLALTAPIYSDFWEIIPQLDKVETQTTTQRIGNILANRPRYSQALSEEKYLGQAGMIEFFKYPKVWSLRSPLDENGQFQWSSIPKIFITSRRQMFQSYTASMNKRIAQADLPYNTRTSPVPIPQDFYSQNLAPIYERMRWNHARAETKIAFLVTELALHSYQLDHDRYPPSLNTLLPRYIKEIPVDPFGKGKPISYKRTQDGYLLYSVGSDGKEDGGHAVENKRLSKENRSRYILAPDSKGDFVAGVNY